MDETDNLPEWRRVVRQHLAAQTGSLDERLAALLDARRAFHAELAAAATPVLNAMLQQRDDGLLESRRKLCSWVNETLRMFGLAIRCPKTGVPSIVIANPRDQDDDRGRFRLEHRDEAGRVARTFSSVDTPALDLMEDPPRREALARHPPPPPSPRTR